MSQQPIARGTKSSDLPRTGGTNGRRTSDTQVRIFDAREGWLVHMLRIRLRTYMPVRRGPSVCEEGEGEPEG